MRHSNIDISLTMLHILFGLILLTYAAAAVKSPVIDDSCETHLSVLTECQGLISFSGECRSAIVNLTNTEYSQCDAVNFFWSYPLNNMTLILDAPFTRSRQAYSMDFDNDQIMSGVSHVYRIFNNQETDVTTHDANLVQYSDSNYQIILKFQGPSRLSRYGLNISYKSIKMF